MKIAYCDCFSGISGDMFLGALLDVGLPMDILQNGLSQLGLGDEFELNAAETHKGALRATRLKVNLNQPENHHNHHNVEHNHYHRNLADITGLISQSGLSSRVKQTSLAIFNRLAKAEAHIHGQSVEEVHFHEVGAVDSIVDVVGAAIGLEWLGIEQLYASSLPLGIGQTESAHGTLPLPAPATLQLLADAHAPTHFVPTQVELVTPTGAAILAALARFEQPAMVLLKIGSGSGERDLPWPNIFRFWVGEIPSEASTTKGFKARLRE
jgi:uncharacterized protein (TIGR00299 family) protein